jgi:hypothetical protein
LVFLILWYHWYSASVFLSCLRTPIHDPTSVSPSIGFISLHSPHSPQYHRYSYTPTNLFYQNTQSFPAEQSSLQLYTGGRMILHKFPSSLRPMLASFHLKFLNVRIVFSGLLTQRTTFCNSLAFLILFLVTLRRFWTVSVTCSSWTFPVMHINAG